MKKEETKERFKIDDIKERFYKKYPNISDKYKETLDIFFNFILEDLMGDQKNEKQNNS